MQKQILAIALSFLSAMLPLKVSAENYDQFYIFGDSLVDNGNWFKLTRGIPPSPPYFLSVVVGMLCCLGTVAEPFKKRLVHKATSSLS